MDRPEGDIRIFGFHGEPKPCRCPHLYPILQFWGMLKEVFQLAAPTAVTILLLIPVTLSDAHFRISIGLVAAENRGPVGV